MAIDHLVEFKQRLAEMRDPRVRRGFLDSFYANLRRKDLSQVPLTDTPTIAAVLDHYGFADHAHRFMVAQGNAFLEEMRFSELTDADVYSGLPTVNSIADAMDSSGLHAESASLIGYFLLQTIGLTPRGVWPHRLPLSPQMAAVLAFTQAPREGLQEKSRFIVLPGTSRVPQTVEIEGVQTAVGYMRDGFMEFRGAPEPLPRSLTYERIRDHPLRGILLVDYQTPVPLLDR